MATIYDLVGGEEPGGRELAEALRGRRRFAELTSLAGAAGNKSLSGIGGSMLDSVDSQERMLSQAPRARQDVQEGYSRMQDRADDRLGRQRGATYLAQAIAAIGGTPPPPDLPWQAMPEALKAAQIAASERNAKTQADASRENARLRAATAAEARKAGVRHFVDAQGNVHVIPNAAPPPGAQSVPATPVVGPDGKPLVAPVKGGGGSRAAGAIARPMKELEGNVSKLDMAINALEAAPGAYGGVGNFAAGLADSVGGTPVQSLTAERFSPEERRARNYITNVMSAILHARAGGNVTKLEMLRQKFLVNDTDSLEAAKQKLADVRAMEKADLDAMAGGQPAAPPPGATIRVRHRASGKTGQMPAANFNPELYEKVE